MDQTVKFISWSHAVSLTSSASIMELLHNLFLKAFVYIFHSILHICHNEAFIDVLPGQALLSDQLKPSNSY